MGGKVTITKSRKYKKWGQACLVSAVLLNGMVLAINLHLTSLEGKLQSKRYDEQYFTINEQTKNAESDRYSLLQGNSSQLVMLRRLADDRLTADERKTILSNVKEINHQSEVSKISVVAITYLLANDLPEGTNPYKLFEGKSDSELTALQIRYENQAGEYMITMKKEMVQLMNAISIWKILHSSALILSSIILIIGSILNLRSELVVPPSQT